MKLAELRDGWNGPQNEIDYVTSVGKSIGVLLGLVRCQGIEIVGSRAVFSYVSANRFYRYLQEYNDTAGGEQDDTMKLFALLDRLAHEHNLCSKDLPLLADHLPTEITGSQRDRIVRSLNRGIASDWDLLIPRFPEGIEPYQRDPLTDAHVEIIVGELHRPKIVHHYPNY